MTREQSALTCSSRLHLAGDTWRGARDADGSAWTCTRTIRCAATPAPLPGTEFPHMSTPSKRLRTLVATGTIATTVALVLAGCGARAGDDTPGGQSAAPSCVD